MRSYDSKRLNELACNILFGMEVIDKRCNEIYHTAKNKKMEDVNFDMSEEERMEAIQENEKFFSDKRMQEKLNRLKYLIVDDTNINKLHKIFNK